MNTQRTISSILCVMMAFALPASARATPPPPKSVSTMITELQSMATGPLQVEWSNGIGSTPSFITGNLPSEGTAPEQIGRNFLNRYGSMYGVRDQSRELTLDKVTLDEQGGQHIRFNQTIDSVPVFGGQMFVHTAGNRITAVNGLFYPDITIATIPQLSENQAVQLVRGNVGDAGAEFRSTRSGLVVYVDSLGKPTLTWKINVYSWINLGDWLYFIDANSGAVVHKLNQLDTAKAMEVYTAGNGTNLPGTFVCGTSGGGCSSSDADIMGAYNNSSKVYDYYKNVFGRFSYNNQDATLYSTVHYGTSYMNAFWNGSQMVYGDGNLYARSFDVVAHELTHAVTEYTSQLIYEFQPGALNESWSDVMSVFAGCSAQTGTADCDWLMGDHLTGGAIRDLANPPAHNQPDNWSGYYWWPLEVDKGGVHENSGIPNKAAYLLTAGGTFNGVTVATIGYAKAEQIYYRAMTHFLNSAATFSTARGALFAACVSLVGSFSITAANCNQVLNAWAAVGIGNTSSSGQAKRAFVPYVTQSVAPTSCSPSQLLSNGNFEAGAANWTQVSGSSYSLITQNPSWVHDGTWAAWMGGYNSANDVLYQTVPIPNTQMAIQISFYVAIGSEDSATTAYDKFYASLQPGAAVTLPEIWMVDNTNQGYWYYYTLTYSELPYAGQNMRIYLHATTDSSLNTNFFVDTTSLTVQCVPYVIPTDAANAPVTVKVERVGAFSGGSLMKAVR